MAKVMRNIHKDSDMYHGSGESEQDIMRHSCEHVMAAALMNLWPKAKRGVGPAIENGFYQDIEIPDYQLTTKDLTKIEEQMQQIKKAKIKFIKGVKKIDDAITYEKKLGQKYKVEILEDLNSTGETTVTYYQLGDYIDLCRGPHAENTSQIGFFKLDRLAGAYWRGNEKNTMLQRVYGLCFNSKEELDKYLWRMIEAKKRDHKKLGVALGLWTFSDLVGPGLPLFTQKGALVRRLINEFVEDLQSKQGIAQVWTPQIAKADLFKKSGHYDKYRENMFHVRSNYSEEEYFLKPMNCPQHTQIYASVSRSYKDLPIRMADFAMLYRDEKPGELNGLIRTRSFSQDDCHIFCREDQVVEEMNKALDMTQQIMEAYHFDYKYRLSVSDPNHMEKYLGDKKTWEKAEKLCEKILKDRGVKYYLGIGEAAFYAPKLDLIATDSLGREWQLSTLQIDYFMPERFDLQYTNSDGKIKRPVMLHRAISGSPERLLAILLEHYGGAFPLWLSPVQIIIIPIADRHLSYANKIASELKKAGIRVEIDHRQESMQAKIRDTTLQKVPYMGIIGDRESQKLEDLVISIRTREGKDLGQMELNKFIDLIKKEIENKS